MAGDRNNPLRLDTDSEFASLVELDDVKECRARLLGLCSLPSALVLSCEGEGDSKFSRAREDLELDNRRERDPVRASDPVDSR